MNRGMRMVEFSINRPRLVTGVMIAVTLALLLLAALPTLFPGVFFMLPPLRVDTDPENMLSSDEPVRVFHNQMKKALTLYDIVVVGVVNDKDPDGVFNPASLEKIHRLTEFAKTLRWPRRDDPTQYEGVVVSELLAPSTVDNIEQGGLGEVRFEWLMPEPPKTREEAHAIRDKAMRLPFLKGTLVSESGKMISLYLPITAKDQSYRVYSALRREIATYDGDEQYHITGLPVANDTFGVEMFIQMGISAPLAMLVIFILMLVFFRKLVLIVSPMIVAMVSVIWTMGLLVITGNTVHIMSSMIPIFIMPIAVLDSIHILSEFFDRYQLTRDRRKTLTDVMQTLFMPMLYTSLTSMAGFASLALTPIPPVQVFGIFVAIGIAAAWLLTICFIPAYIMFIPQEKLENFGAVHAAGAEGKPAAHTPVERILAWLDRFTWRRVKLIFVGAAVLAVLSVYGISAIVINDNPTKWFKASHPIRAADTVLNEHFGGTYMAYLALRPTGATESAADFLAGMRQRLEAFVRENEGMSPGLAKAAAALREQADAAGARGADTGALLAEAANFIEERLAAAEGDEVYAWEDLARFIGVERQRGELYKQPETLRYLEQMQRALEATAVVGKTNSIADLVKTVHRELFEGADEAYRIPDTASAVAQCLLTFESSHRPNDLYHFVTPDYREGSIWVQLKSGDNQDMNRVVDAMAAFTAENPPPFGLEPEWFGLTYINVVWQDKMVWGMAQSFLGAFLIVLLMMIVLFRSGLWGLLSMIPLSLTIALIYGVMGFTGKDYDMPVAVLSALTLGLAVDFAIHFLARAREIYMEKGNWADVHSEVFGEPARAIMRNVIVVAVGFLPLLLAPLMPYITVGFFMAAILFLSGATTLVLLPALVKTLEPLLFPKTRICSVTCQCGTCIVSGLAAVAVVAVNVQQFLYVGWTTLSWVSLVLLPIIAGSCWLLSRRTQCAPQDDRPSC